MIVAGFVAEQIVGGSISTVANQTSSAKGAEAATIQPQVEVTRTGDILDERGKQGSGLTEMPTTVFNVPVVGPRTVTYNGSCGNMPSGPSATIIVGTRTIIGPQKDNWVQSFTVPSGTYTVHIESSCPFELYGER